MLLASAHIRNRKGGKKIVPDMEALSKKFIKRLSLFRSVFKHTFSQGYEIIILK